MLPAIPGAVRPWDPAKSLYGGELAYVEGTAVVLPGASCVTRRFMLLTLSFFKERSLSWVAVRWVVAGWEALPITRAFLRCLNVTEHSIYYFCSPLAMRS